jgi:hypothetical protein
MISKFLRRWLFVPIVVLGLGGPAQPASAEHLPAASEAPAVEPKAVQLLRAMSDYLAGLRQFSLRVDSSLDLVLDSGQKLQFDMGGQVLVRRPNGIYAIRKGAALDQEFFYDGRHLTLSGKTAQVYARVEAPARIDEALDFARDRLNLMAPLADFLYSDPYKVLSAEMESGFYVGPALLDGVPCHHLAFRGRDLDWQVWIEDSKTPLPHKYLITSPEVQGAPQFTARLSNWNPAPKASDADFRFAPPAAAEKIEFLPLAAAAAAPQ